MDGQPLLSPISVQQCRQRQLLALLLTTFLNPDLYELLDHPTEIVTHSCSRGNEVLNFQGKNLIPLIKAFTCNTNG